MSTASRFLLLSHGSPDARSHENPALRLRAHLLSGAHHQLVGEMALSQLDEETLGPRGRLELDDGVCLLLGQVGHRDPDYRRALDERQLLELLEVGANIADHVARRGRGRCGRWACLDEGRGRARPGAMRSRGKPGGRAVEDAVEGEVVATQAGKALGEDAAIEKAAELALDEGRPTGAAVVVGSLDGGQQMLGQDAVQDRGGRRVAVRWRKGGGRQLARPCNPAHQPAGETRRDIERLSPRDVRSRRVGNLAQEGFDSQGRWAVVRSPPRQASGRGERAPPPRA